MSLVRGKKLGSLLDNRSAAWTVRVPGRRRYWFQITSYPTILSITRIERVIHVTNST